eukprot:15449944-Alexandrium_andersonii.AAC.1
MAARGAWGFTAAPAVLLAPAKARACGAAWGAPRVGLRNALLVGAPQCPARRRAASTSSPTGVVRTLAAGRRHRL